jgi:peptide/nickel transport system substrate-binding protein
VKRFVPLALTLTLVACSRPTPTGGDVLTVALGNSPTNLDPGVGADEGSQKLHQLLYSSLLKIDETLRVVPDLAVRFDTVDSLTWIAQIPDGVRFHDGRPLTSADVAFTFRRFLDPAFVSVRKGAYRDLAGVDIVDATTVAFRLKQPSASFPINLVMGIVPAGTSAAAGRQPIGTGPYRLESFVADDRVVLAANTDYYKGAPRNRALIFKVVPDETMRGLELRNGSVDIVVNDLSPDLVHGLETDGAVQVVQAPGTDYAYVGMNLRDPSLADRRVRQALGYAIDTGAIITHLRRGLARTAATLVPSISWAHAPDAFQFTHDPARARALLDEAGLHDPDGPGGEPRLRLSLKTSTAEAYRLQAAVIQQQLADVGIALDLRSYEFATLLSDVVRGNVQLYTLQYVGITDPDMLRRAFHSSQVPPAGFNRGHYRSAAADRLIDLATAALDDQQRREYYQEAQRVIAEDAPYISLWARTNIVVAQKSLTGITVSPTADFAFLRLVARLDAGRVSSHASRRALSVLISRP